MRRVGLYLFWVVAGKKCGCCTCSVVVCLGVITSSIPRMAGLPRCHGQNVTVPDSQPEACGHMGR